MEGVPAAAGFTEVAVIVEEGVRPKSNPIEGVRVVDWMGAALRGEEMFRPNRSSAPP